MPKNILYAVHWYELSGAELFAQYCMKQANELGHSCICVATVQSENPEKDAFEAYCEQALEFEDFGDPENFDEFIGELISNHRIEVVHIHHSALMYQALPGLRERFPHLRVVDTTHILEYGNGGFPQLSAVYSPYIDIHNVASRGLLQAQRELYRQTFGKDLDDRKFRLTYTSSLTKACLEPNWTNDGIPRVITFYGRLSVQKQPYVFVATIERLIEENPQLDVEAHIYGDGELRSELESRIARSKHSSRLRYLGRFDDKRKVFERTSILLLSSLNEGLSFTSYEALLHNRLVVSSDVGDQGELIASECLVPITHRFIEESASRLADFLMDSEKYSRALKKCKDKLETIRQYEVSPLEIEGLYG